MALLLQNIKNGAGGGTETRKSKKRQSQSIVPVTHHHMGRQSQSIIGMSSLFTSDEDTFNQAFNEGLEKSRDLSCNGRTVFHQYKDDSAFFNTFTSPVITRVTNKNDFGNESQRMMVDHMLEESKGFQIRGKRFEFLLGAEDPIFNLTGPTQTRNMNTSQCFICELAFKNMRNITFCDFCGNPLCKACVAKQRPFQKAQTASIIQLEGANPRGNICVVCDRKFYIKDMLQVTLDTIETNQAIIANLQSQVKAANDECLHLDEDFEYFASLKREEKASLKVQNNQIKQKKETLKNEIQCINEEYKIAYDKKVQMQQDMNELQDAIQEINSGLSASDEELLKVKIKIRQADLEREKLEQELQALRKIIGKQSRGKNAQQKSGTSNTVNQQQPKAKEDPKKKGSSDSLSPIKRNGKQQSSPYVKEDLDGADMYFNLASVDEGSEENGYLGGSQTQLPEYNNRISTIGADEDSGLEFGRFSSGSTRGKNSIYKKKNNKYRRDNQTYCGQTGGNQKCSIF